MKVMEGFISASFNQKGNISLSQLNDISSQFVKLKK